MGLPEAIKVLEHHASKTLSDVAGPSYEQMEEILTAFAEKKSDYYCGECLTTEKTKHAPGCSMDDIPAPKEDTDQERIMIRALEASWEHWKNNYKRSLMRDFSFGVGPQDCVCCKEYLFSEGKCPSCPLSAPKENPEEWCCGGRWKKAWHEKFKSPVDFPALQEACKAVRDYIKGKLDEAKGKAVQFGVGDIVQDVEANVYGEIISVTHGGITFQPNRYRIKGASGLEWSTWPRVSSPNLKLIFPASRILDFLGYKPSGHVVKSNTGVYGMVCAYTDKEITILWWFSANLNGLGEFGIITYSHEDILSLIEIVWPCRKGE